MLEWDPEEKTEEPTPFRRNAARELGQVARSRDLMVAVSLLGGFATARVLGPWLGSQTGAVARSLFDALGAEPEALSLERLNSLAHGAGLYLLMVSLPVAAAVASGTAAAACCQGGFAVHAALVAPDVSRLSPWNGARKLFSARSPARGAFAAVKIALVGWLLLEAIRSTAAPRYLAAAGSGALRPALLAGLAWNEATGFGMRLGLGLLLVALVEYAFQRWLHERALRMSPAELREEFLHLEGDPNLRNRRRRIWLEIWQASAARRRTDEAHGRSRSGGAHRSPPSRRRKRGNETRDSQ